MQVRDQAYFASTCSDIAMTCPQLGSMGAYLEVGKGMGCLQGWDDAFQPGHHLEGLQGLLICDCKVLCTPNVTQVAVLWPNARVVQPGNK